MSSQAVSPCLPVNNISKLGFWEVGQVPDNEPREKPRTQRYVWGSVFQVEPQMLI